MNTATATGTFSVTMTPADPPQTTAGALTGRFLLDKHYQGPLQAHGLGEMMSAGTAVKGSAGYVAIERVSGTLDGRSGSFVLQHSGSMHRGEASLHISIVADSGTEDLAGLSGSLEIRIDAGVHHYTLSYQLA